MSLFKARDWWSTVVGEDEEYDLGCLCVANIDNSSSGTDKIIVGSFNGILRIYHPKPAKSSLTNDGFRPEDLIVETRLSQPILQLATGNFISGNDKLQLAILHPRKISIHSMSSSQGTVEHGNQYLLNLIYEHQLQRTAYNFCHGPFGGAKGRDFLCVQSMDGTLTIYEQETLSFSRFLPDALLPGPICYNAKTDSFITVSAGRNVESYKYQGLATATDSKTKEDLQNVRTGKRVAADWTFNIGENCIDIRTMMYKDGSRSLVVLGERNFFCLTEGGKLKFMKKFEYNPSAFHPYMCKEDGTVLTLIATHTKTLIVFRDNLLCWAAQLETVPVHVVTAKINDLAGVMVILDDRGRLSCIYLGTDPSISVVPPAADSRDINYNEQDQEMRSLQRAIKSASTKDSFSPSIKSEDEITMSVSIPNKLDEDSHALETKVHDDEYPIPSISIKIVIKAKAHVENVSLSIHIPSPITATDQLFSFLAISPNMGAEASVCFYMCDHCLPHDLSATATANYTTLTGAPRIAQCTVRLPLKLVVKACSPVKVAQHKITLETNKPSVNLNDIFPDLLGPNIDGPGGALGFQYYGGPVVTVLAAKSSQRYRIQCDTFEALWLVANELSNRLTTYHNARNLNDFKLSYTQALPLEEYFEVIDEHFKVRMDISRMDELLSQRAAQFRAIQRRLLTRFKDKTPAPLDSLDTLLEGTYFQLLTLADSADENQAMLTQTSGNLSAATHLINLLIRLWLDLSNGEFYMLQSCLTPRVHDSNGQGWEETVDGAVTHLLRTSLSKTSKDATLNPTPFSVPSDTSKLKKHLTLFCEKLGKGTKLPVEGLSKHLDTSLPGASPILASDRDSPRVKKTTQSASTVTNDNGYQDDGTNLGDAEVPVGSKFGENRSPREVKPSRPVKVALPALDSINDRDESTSCLSNLPSLPGMNQLGQGLDQLSLKQASIRDKVPDLSDMAES